MSLSLDLKNTNGRRLHKGHYISSWDLILLTRDGLNERNYIELNLKPAKHATNTINEVYTNDVSFIQHVHWQGADSCKAGKSS